MTNLDIKQQPSLIEKALEQQFVSLSVSLSVPVSVSVSSVRRKR